MAGETCGCGARAEPGGPTMAELGSAMTAAGKGLTCLVTIPLILLGLMAYCAVAR